MARRAKLTARPILPVGDMARTSEFYRLLGFEVAEWDDGYAWVREDGEEVLQLRVVDGLDLVANPSSAYLQVHDADRWYARIAGALGASGISPISNKPWDMREFSFTDPSGNLVRVGQNLE